MNFSKKRYFWLALLVFSFTITGCYNIHVEQQINQDGSGRIKTTYDFSQLMMTEEPDTEDLEGFEGPDLEAICEDFHEEDLPLTDKNCEIIEDHTVLISGNIQPTR